MWRGTIGSQLFFGYLWQNTFAVKSIARFIDYTVLKPGTDREAIQRLCETAMAHSYAAVCVSPYWVGEARKLVEGSKVKVCSVVGFPHGLHLPETKREEARVLIEAGAQELDMVTNLNALRSGDMNTLRTEIAGFQELCAAWRVTSKVILETGLLDISEIATLCTLCVEEEVNFVKTSTGFAATGAELDKVSYMRKMLPHHVRIKASGGIRDYDTARAFIEAGATRIGTSTAIVEPVSK